MSQALETAAFRWLSRAVSALIVLGGILILVESFWITWGVFIRYVLRSPDSMITEATALLLVPLAFVGMAHALNDDAFPKVTLLVEKFPERIRSVIHLFNMALMFLIGIFFSMVGVSAAFRTYNAGNTTDILEWSEWIFWVPIAIFFVVFTILALSLLIFPRRPTQDGA
jgi:TRAP-type C4-dicarboxylate transport system permease small subunit